MVQKYKNKKLLIVTQHFFPESFRVNDLVEGFVEDGIDVDVLCGLPNYPSGEWAEGYGYIGHRKESYCGSSVIRTAEIRRKNNTSIRIFLNYVSWPITASLKALRLTSGYDAILCYNTSPVLMIVPARIAAWVNKARLVTYVLDVWPENLYTVLAINSRLIKRITKWVCDKLYSLCDCLVAISESQAINLSKRAKGSLCDSSIFVAPQHCEQLYEEHIYSKQLQSQYDSQCLFVFAGSITPAQDLTTVVNAFDIALSKSKRPLKMVILGDGMSKTEIQKHVVDRGLGDSILFKGRVDPRVVTEYMCVAAAMLCPFADSPELEMTIPAKISSCMAAEKPILAVMRGEGAKAVSDARCGFVSTPGDVSALADNLCAIASLPKIELEQMGKNAFNYYRQHYSRRTCLNTLETALFE